VKRKKDKPMPRYKYDSKTKKVVEITTERKTDGKNIDRALWSDAHYDGARTTDGKDIGSRKKHRQYMRDNNLTTVDDYTNEWTAASKEREHYKAHGGTVTKDDIRKAIHQLESQNNGK
jgi:hypothetical protein